MAKWEIIDAGNYGVLVECTDRMRVEGGWLYRTMLSDDRTRFEIALVFVPDGPPIETIGPRD